MASRDFDAVAYQLEKKLVTLFMRVTIGASGAPTLVTAVNTTDVNGNVISTWNPSKGVATIVRVSAGKYTVQLGRTDGVTGNVIDTYTGLLGVGVTVTNSTLTSVIGGQILSDTVKTNGQFQFQFVSAAGVAADPANGDVTSWEIILKNYAL